MSSSSTKKKVDIRTRLAKQMGLKSDALISSRRNNPTVVRSKMEKVLEKFRIEYATQNKTYLGVKLTDSFLNSCMNFKNQKIQLKDGCMIRFNSGDGEISIPGLSDNRLFKFRSNRSNQEIDECLVQKGDTIFVTGLITKRLNIQGNEDAYKATKEKMTLVDQENKKNGTKVIKTGFGRFDKTPQTQPKSVPKVQAPQTNAKSMSSLSKRPRPEIDPAEAASRRNSTHPRPLPAGTRTSKPVTSPTAEDKEEAPANLDFSAIMNYTYRERIVHLLAIRPYKKIELKLVLDRHGPSERDKLPWTSVLGSIAMFNPRENSYSLRPISYDEVMENWPFYDDETRHVVKKKLEELRHGPISPCSSSSSSSHSSSSSTGQKQQKRSASDERCVPAQKQRIAHPQKPTAVQDPVALPPVPLTLHLTNVLPLQPPSVDVCRGPSPKRIAVDYYPLDNFISNEELKSLASRYGPILDKSQRDKYREEFEAGSRDYNMMYGHLSQTVEVFASWQRRLKASTDPSEIEVVEDMVYRRYQDLMNDHEFVSQHSAVKRLGIKLDHIRAMIKDFEKRRALKSSSS